MLDTKSIIEKSSKFTVLFVEDNQDLLKSTARFLQEFFLKVDTACDGKAGIQKYQDYYKKHDKYYDIVISDVNLPTISGLDMIENFKNLNSQQVCISLSAYSDVEYLQKSIEIGIDAYLIKPISYRLFIKVLNSVIEKIQIRQKVQLYQKRLEELLEQETQRKKIAQEESRRKSKFLASMSHEIRNPLTAILGYIDLLIELENDKQKLEYLEVVDYSSKSLLYLVNDILDLSKIEQNKLDIVIKDFDTHYEFGNIINLFLAKANDKKITLKTDINPKIPKVLKSDILRVKQIISNLLSNAIKFADTQIELKISYHDEKLIIDVWDDGIGMSQKQQSKIFLEYTQATNSTAHQYGGTGLGLSITLKLVELLGGDIQLDSKQTQYSRFTITIPMQGGDIKNIKTHIITDNYKFTGHILLAEDNNINQKFVWRLLTNIGLSCDCANNGSEAYDMYRNNDYDLILMDVNMPVLNGIRATKLIREYEQINQVSKIPIISLSANARDEDIQSYLMSGMDDYIAKPILRDRINEVFIKYLPYKKIPKKNSLKQKDSIDIESLAKNTGFSIQEIIQMFGELTQLVDSESIAMTKALEDENFDIIYSSAHKIKGSAFVMSANSIGLIAQTIEQLAKSHKKNDLKESFDQLIAQKHELAQMVKTYESF